MYLNNNYFCTPDTKERFMKKIFVFTVCCMAALFAWGNDGVFYADGNHLIPISETDISVKKEILTINRNGDKIEVNVYYEFFNPSDEKEVLVGFEADAHGTDPRNSFPQHPAIGNFKVVMNGQTLDYDIAHVDRHFENGRKVPTSYVNNGRIEGMSLEQCEKELDEMEAPEAICDYVYHFSAKFRPGLNIIQHTYDFDISYTQVYSGNEYEGVADFFPYILTAANRWANHQIDDFTLIINMGDRTSFTLLPTFYNSASQWTIMGKGKTTVTQKKDAKEYIQFNIIQGSIQFHQENFHPDGELRINDIYPHFDWNAHSLQSQNVLEGLKLKLYRLYLSDYFLQSNRKEEIYNTYTPEQRRILKNLPFAYRGYIFKDKTLQEYFESSEWYIADPDYQADMQMLTDDEQKWVEFWK